MFTPLVFLTVVPLQLPAQAGQHRTCLAQKTVEAYNLMKVRRQSVSLVSLVRALCAAPPHEPVFLTAFVNDESLVGSLRVTVCVTVGAHGGKCEAPRIGGIHRHIEPGAPSIQGEKLNAPAYVAEALYHPVGALPPSC